MKKNKSKNHKDNKKILEEDADQNLNEINFQDSGNQDEDLQKKQETKKPQDLKNSSKIKDLDLESNEPEHQAKKSKQAQLAEKLVKIIRSNKKQEDADLLATPSLEEQLQQKQKDYLYLQAEFENYKRQALKDRHELSRYGASALVQSLVDNVLDDLERSLLSKSDNVEEIKKGLQIINKKLNESLNRFGVTSIDPKGKVFDPSYQEALSQEKSSEVPPGHVLTTFKKAYKLYDKVIRPAQVVVTQEDPSNPIESKDPSDSSDSIDSKDSGEPSDPDIQ